MADRDAKQRYLSHYTNDYLIELCNFNKLDVTLLKNKDERVEALSDLPLIRESEMKATGGTVMPEVLELLKHFEISRKDDSQVFQNLLLKMVKENKPKGLPRLKEFHRLTKEDDVLIYLRMYENLAKNTYSIADDKLGATLEPYLTGPAQKAYDSLSPDDKRVFSIVKKAILKRYRLTPEDYRLKFQHASKESDETFADLIFRLREYTNYWLTPDDDLVHNRSFVKVLDKILLGQLLNSIGDDTLRMKLMEAGADGKSISEIGIIADQYVCHKRTNHHTSSSRPGVTSHSTKVPGQYSTSWNSDRDVSRDKASVGSSRTGVSGGHTSVNKDGANFLKGREVHSSKRYSDACYSCGELGHKKRECPKLQTSNSPVENVQSRRLDGAQSHKAVNFTRTAQTCMQNGLNPLAPEFKPEQTLKGPVIQLKANDVEMSGLADSGAEISRIRADICSELNLTPSQRKTTLQWFEGTKMQTKGCVMIDFECLGLRVCAECVVVDNLSHPFLLGQDFCSAIGLTIDFGDNSYWSSRQKPVIKWPLMGLLPSVSDSTVETDKNEKSHDDPEKVAKRQTAVDLLKEEFSDVLTEQPGFTNVLEHEILLKEGTVPVKQKPYRLSPAKEKSAMEQIPKMLEDGVIEESKSLWCSPVVMVPKSNDTFRMCVDFRKLNSSTVSDSYPLNRIDKIMSKLHGAKIFSVLDMRSGYWQVGLRKEDRELSAFSIGQNLYQFKVLPFGVKNGCATFQRLVEKVLKNHNCLGRICEVHIDDIIIFSLTWEEHFEHIREVLTCLREAGLTASLVKSKFFQDNVASHCRLCSSKKSERIGTVSWNVWMVFKVH
jgi:hypothetical protein